MEYSHTLILPMISALRHRCTVNWKDEGWLILHLRWLTLLPGSWLLNLVPLGSSSNVLIIVSGTFVGKIDIKSLLKLKQ